MYNCKKCPGYCCSYPVIEVTPRDLTRLAQHFGVSLMDAEKRFTKRAHGYPRVMRRKNDDHYGKICGFFDRVKRNCSIYSARPEICRRFPAEKRCGYYDFLAWERRHQNDPDFIATTDNGLWT